MQIAWYKDLLKVGQNHYKYFSQTWSGQCSLQIVRELYQRVATCLCVPNKYWNGILKEHFDPFRDPL